MTRLAGLSRPESPLPELEIRAFVFFSSISGKNLTCRKRPLIHQNVHRLPFHRSYGPIGLGSAQSPLFRFLSLFYRNFSGVLIKHFNMQNVFGHYIFMYKYFASIYRFSANKPTYTIYLMAASCS